MSNCSTSTQNIPLQNSAAMESDDDVPLSVQIAKRRINRELSSDDDDAPISSLFGKKLNGALKQKDTCVFPGDKGNVSMLVAAVKKDAVEVESSSDHDDAIPGSSDGEYFGVSDSKYIDGIVVEGNASSDEEEAEEEPNEDDRAFIDDNQPSPLQSPTGSSVSNTSGTESLSDSEVPKEVVPALLEFSETIVKQDSRVLRTRTGRNMPEKKKAALRDSEARRKMPQAARRKNTHPDLRKKKPVYSRIRSVEDAQKKKEAEATKETRTEPRKEVNWAELSVEERKNVKRVAGLVGVKYRRVPNKKEMSAKAFEAMQHMRTHLRVTRKALNDSLHASGYYEDDV
eukprot:764230-Hanusia_phi.AAC.4